MTQEPSTPDQGHLDPAERERRRRAAALLGDLEPQVTRDETAEGWNDEGGTSRDQEILRDVPPHHGS